MGAGRSCCINKTKKIGEGPEVNPVKNIVGQEIKSEQKKKQKSLKCKCENKWSLWVHYVDFRIENWSSNRTIFNRVIIT